MTYHLRNNHTKITPCRKLNTGLAGHKNSNDHDGRYYTEAEIIAILDCLGPLNPMYHKIHINSLYMTLNAGTGLTYHELSFDKAVDQFMPFLIYTDACFNCHVFLSSNISGKNATIYLIPENIPSSSFTYNVWYLAVTVK